MAYSQQWNPAALCKWLKPLNYFNPQGCVTIQDQHELTEFPDSSKTEVRDDV